MSRDAAAAGWCWGLIVPAAARAALSMKGCTQSVQRRTLAACSARKPRPRRRLRETEARPCRTAPTRWECDDPRGNAGRTGTFRRPAVRGYTRSVSDPHALCANLSRKEGLCAAIGKTLYQLRARHHRAMNTRNAVPFLLPAALVSGLIWALHSLAHTRSLSSFVILCVVTFAIMASATYAMNHMQEGHSQE